MDTTCFPAACEPFEGRENNVSHSLIYISYTQYSYFLFLYSYFLIKIYI